MFLVSAPTSIESKFLHFVWNFLPTSLSSVSLPVFLIFFITQMEMPKRGDSAEKGKTGERKMELLKGLLWIADERQKGN